MKSIESPTRLRLRTEIQPTRFGQKMEREKQLGDMPIICIEFAERTQNEATFFKPKMEWEGASSSTVNQKEREREREYIVDSGASTHVMSKTQLSPEELETAKCHELPRLSSQRMDRSTT